MNAHDIAPCGMNCTLCRSYQRKTRNCKGCRSADQFKVSTCLNCPIKHCTHLPNTIGSLCCDCESFPCKRLTLHDGRLKLRYHISVLDNLRTIHTHGLDCFLAQQNIRWTCTTCNQLLCVHRNMCIHCKTPLPKEQQEKQSS